MSGTRSSLADVQGVMDTRGVSINRAGIRAIRHPVKILDKSDAVQHTVGSFNMSVSLGHQSKGAHMSRFVELLNNHDEPLSIHSFEGMVRGMIEKLEADCGYVEMTFPYFLRKFAPVTQAPGLLDYGVTFLGQMVRDRYGFSMKVVVPVTSLCPCSKQIASYGAHNQRSHLSILIRGNEGVWIEDLIRIAEDQASCELYSLVKRSDEKYITEKAYDNPKFVEDVVRDIAALLEIDPRIDAYVVESENFESIHNHSAYALIERNKIVEAEPTAGIAS
jgi:GTP cyclohydrolase I